MGSRDVSVSRPAKANLPYQERVNVQAADGSRQPTEKEIAVGTAQGRAFWETVSRPSFSQ